MKDKTTQHKQIGFKVPEDYFDHLEDELMMQVTLKSTLPDHTGFEVPESYFDNLTDELMEDLSTTDDEVAVRSLNWWYMASAVAASIVIVISFNLWGSSHDIENQLAQLETEDIENYLTVSTAVMNHNTLEELFYEDSGVLEGMSYNSEITQDVLFEYLNEELESNQILLE